jgi:hypothetical protein
MVDGTPPFIEQPTQTVIWVWDGVNWERINTSNGRPTGRYSSAAVYDADRNVIVSFGGRVGKDEKIINDTWEWNSNEWKDLTDPTRPARDHHAMAYDRERKRTILFGGGVFPRVPGPWSQDTWEWDGKQWKLVATEGPPGRVSTIVYDNIRMEVILFGGVGAPGADGNQPNFKDTWSWNGKEWKNVGNDGPNERSRHAMVFDSRRGKVLLYGGERNNSQQLGDMWEWDGKQWKEIKLADTNPGTRRVHAMAYDEARGVTVLFGGMHEKTLMSDTWEWDGRVWKNVN